MKEMCAAKVEWEIADRALAAANYRRNRAEREFHRVFQERMDTIARTPAVSSNKLGSENG
jgi:hypothetical protein